MTGPYGKPVQQPGFYIRAAMCIFIPAALARAFAFLRLYLDSFEDVSPVALYCVRWAYLLFLCFSDAAALTLIAVAIYTSGRKCAASVTSLFVLCRSADAVCQFFVSGPDGANAGLSEYDSILSAVSQISELLVIIAVAFGVWILSAAFFRTNKAREYSRKYSLKSSVNAAILLYFAVPFVRLLVRFSAQVIAADWQLSVTAIRTFVYEAVEILVFYAVFAFIGSRIALAVSIKRDF